MYIPSDPKLWQGVGNDKLIRRPKFWLPLLVALIISYWTPENIYQNIPFLDQLTRCVSDLVPSIDKWVERSSFPIMTRLLHTYLWLIMPYLVCVIINQKGYLEIKTDLNKQQAWRMFFIGFPGILLMLIIFFFNYYMFALPEDHDCTRECIHESRFLQFFYASLMTMAISYLASIVIAFLIKLPKIIFNLVNKGD